MPDAVTEAHEEKETLKVEVFIPEHAARGGATPLFNHSRDALIARDGGRCWVCQRNAEEAGPLEAHHYPVERCLAEAVDWSVGSLIRRDFPLFDWAAFDRANDIYFFVDDMRVNGKLLCKDHHTHGDTGIHTLPHPLWVAQRYAKEGYQFTPDEKIHHDQV